jgi:hypothetical protein
MVVKSEGFPRCTAVTQAAYLPLHRGGVRRLEGLVSGMEVASPHRPSFKEMPMRSSIRRDVICAALLTALALAIFAQNHISVPAQACPGTHCPTLP